MISETLDMYEENFTPEERMLFENSLEGESKLLNQVIISCTCLMTMSYLFRQIEIKALEQVRRNT